MFEAKEIIPHNRDWIALIFFTVFIILVIVKISFNERLKHTITLFFSKKYLIIYFNKDKNKVLNWFQFLFFLVQLLVISLYFSLILSYLNAEKFNLDVQLFAFILAYVLIYFLARHLVGAVLAFILGISNIYKKLFYEKMNYLNNLIIWMLPIVLLLVYFENGQSFLFQLAVIVFVVLLILRYALLLKNNKKLIFNNFFYFILYLCALEIVPLVIILKITI